MDNVLPLLGIARKAGKLEVGEEPVGASARARQARLILVAGDAAENSVRRAAHFAQSGRIACLVCPYSKAELGGTVGRSSCAMLALTDVGLASAVAEKLALREPDRYGPAAAELSALARRARQRQQEQRAHQKNRQRGGYKASAPPERPHPPSGAKSRPPRAAPPPEGGRPPQPGRPKPRKIVSIRRNKP